MNAVEIQEAIEELIQQPYAPSAFIEGFMTAYGASAATIARIKSGDGNATDLPDGVLWKKWVHFQPASIGEISEVLDTLQASRKTAQAKVRFAITTDGDQFAAHDLKTGEILFCPLAKLDEKFNFFLPIAGIDRYEIADENPVDIKATGKLAKLYDALIAENPDWATDVRRHDMNQFMTRVIFCLFAEDTGIFRDNIFSETLATRCSAHPENIAPTLETMFEVMNLNDKDGSRDGQPAWACAFPYVNGGLFAGSLKAPEFDWMGWRYLRDAGKLDWRVINPDIFGSMIQSIVNTDERGELGMHYTSVPNILKVLNPLFLDGLREEVEAGWESKAKLQAVLKRLMKIRVFDPACGSGNFLVIAYREMREIEIRVLKRLQEMTGEMAGLWSHVELKNFYGIEIGDFAAETAKLALWIAQHQMNRKFEGAFGRLPPELPLQHGANIVADNALRVDWITVCPVALDAEVETYVAGNPPYVGDKKQTPDQKSDIKNICEIHTSRWKSLDYVAGWIFKSTEFCKNRNAKFSFVATNSICQGAPVGALWGYVLNNGMEIDFAHTSFKWSNNAANNAAVMCVIVGVRNKNKSNKVIYSNDLKSLCHNISPYLTNSEDIIVEGVSKPISNIPAMDLGNMAKDGGNLIFTSDELSNAIKFDPGVSDFILPFMGSDELINGYERYCLWLNEESAKSAMQHPEIFNRINAVRDFRLKSKKAETQKWAAKPYRFVEIRSAEYHSALIIPRVSSERRPYLPASIISKKTIISDLAYAIYDPSNWVMSLIVSRLHLVWIAAICGRLETRYRYSNTMGWNTFPVPDLSPSQKDELSSMAELISLTRESHFPATIADLYNPDKMPADLLEAHRANDEAIEKIYIGRPFRNDTERLEHLFKRYTKMVASKGRA